MSKIKVGIVGAGSAGLFAANELGNQLGNKIEIKIYDAGPAIENRYCPQKNEYECAQCDPCRIMSGIGGAGAWSSGILNLNKNIGGNLNELCSRANLNVDDVMKQIDDLFLKNGAPDRIFDP
ncbi:MAG: FAD-dependent oxidoreductase, partial [Promethearchaeota archaeon]